MPTKALITSLNYKASNISAAEEKYNMDFFSALDKIGSSMRSLQFLFCAGGADNEDFDKYMEEKGLQEAAVLILDGINKAGFLGKTIDMEAVKKAMTEATEEAAKAIETSPSTGELVNA